MFIHGAWVTPACWQPFSGFFAERGYQCITPAWPGKDRSVDAIRSDPSPLVGLGIAEIANRFDQVVRALPEPPILVGHSFGGLIVQILLDHGLGACASRSTRLRPGACSPSNLQRSGRSRRS